MRRDSEPAAGFYKGQTGVNYVDLASRAGHDTQPVMRLRTDGRVRSQFRGSVTCTGRTEHA
jgi:hypothetical protein